VKTKTTSASEIKRAWHLIDAQDQILGRLATKIVRYLIGKDKPYFVPYLDCGDYVVVINAAKVRVTGRKKQQKMYYRHSGYPGGFREINFAKQMEKDARKIIRHAVAGMLPKNKLRVKRLARLKISIDAKHDYQDKFKEKRNGRKKKKKNQ
jgi:large subunit ribosomal protein L13